MQNAYNIVTCIIIIIIFFIQDKFSLP